jgi:hypothetical protein
MTKAVDRTQQDRAEPAVADVPPHLHEAVLLDWNRDNLDDLRRLMSRRDVDLETAAQVFFNGTPARYNMIAKTDLLPQAQARCNLLDSIHRRITCGFYLPDPARGLGQARGRMQDWIAGQRSDAALGRSGRWVFDSALLDIQVTGPARPMILPRPVLPAALDSLWRRLARMIWRDRQVKPPCELEE